MVIITLIDRFIWILIGSFVIHYFIVFVILLFIHKLDYFYNNSLNRRIKNLFYDF